MVAQGKNTVRVSIIIPLFNGENTIEECMSSLRSLQYPHPYEIIIIDNNSSDRSVEKIKPYVNGHTVRLYSERKQGSYAARNKGIRLARGAFIAFTDADCIVQKDWLTNITKRLEEHTVGGVGGKIVPYRPETDLERFGDKYIFNEEKKPFPYLGTGNCVFRKDVLWELHLFDERFLSGGDVDLSLRIQKQGYRLLYQPDAVICHKHRTSLKAFFCQYYTYGKGWKILRGKWGTQSSLFRNVHGYRKGMYALYHVLHFLLLYPYLHLRRKKVTWEDRMNVFSQLYLAIQDGAFFLGYTYIPVSRP